MIVAPQLGHLKPLSTVPLAPIGKVSRHSIGYIEDPPVCELVCSACFHGLYLDESDGLESAFVECQRVGAQSKNVIPIKVLWRLQLEVQIIDLRIARGRFAGVCLRNFTSTSVFTALIVRVAPPVLQCHDRFFEQSVGDKNTFGPNDTSYHTTVTASLLP